MFSHNYRHFHNPFKTARLIYQGGPKSAPSTDDSGVDKKVDQAEGMKAPEQKGGKGMGKSLLAFSNEQITKLDNRRQLNLDANLDAKLDKVYGKKTADAAREFMAKKSKEADTEAVVKAPEKKEKAPGRRERAMQAKARAMDKLREKGATLVNQFTFEEAYNPKVAPTMKKIFKKEGLNPRKPDDWASMHTLLMDKNGEYYNETYDRNFTAQQGWLEGNDELFASMVGTVPGEVIDFTEEGGGSYVRVDRPEGPATADESTKLASLDHPER